MFKFTKILLRRETQRSKPRKHEQQCEGESWRRGSRSKRRRLQILGSAAATARWIRAVSVLGRTKNLVRSESESSERGMKIAVDVRVSRDRSALPSLSWSSVRSFDSEGRFFSNEQQGNKMADHHQHRIEGVILHWLDFYLSGDWKCEQQ